MFLHVILHVFLKAKQRNKAVDSMSPYRHSPGPWRVFMQLRAELQHSVFKNLMVEKRFVKDLLIV